MDPARYLTKEEKVVAIRIFGLIFQNTND
jgi:hypothetical protein